MNTNDLKDIIMCDICGCGQDEFSIHQPGRIHEHEHSHGDEQHSHPHDHGNTHGQQQDHEHNYTHEGMHGPLNDARHRKVISLNVNIMSQNNIF